MAVMRSSRGRGLPESMHKVGKGYSLCRFMGSDGPTFPLQPDVFPGNCWAFEGDQGQVVIRLPGRVQLSDITLQHPPASVAHTGGAKSAPRDFAVYVSGTEA